PVAPVTPCAPVAPVAPAAPVAPFSPAAPVSPLAPVAPVAPVAPADPVAPALPFSPVAPMAPAAPAAPVAPVAPVTPLAPAAPGVAVIHETFVSPWRHFDLPLRILTVPFLATQAVTVAAEACCTRTIVRKTSDVPSSDATAASGRANERSSPSVFTGEIHSGEGGDRAQATVLCAHAINRPPDAVAL